MTPTEEELRICKLLPKHEWEITDWLMIDGYDTPFFVTKIDGDQMWIEPKDPSKVDYEGPWLFGNLWLNSDEQWERVICHLPRPHQILALKEWPRYYVLMMEKMDTPRIKGPLWVVFDMQEYDGTELPFESQIRASTARLACLKAIEPFLKESES